MNTFLGTLDICQVWGLLDQWLRKKQWEVNLPPTPGGPTCLTPPGIGLHLRVLHQSQLNENSTLIIMIKISPELLDSQVELKSSKVSFHYINTLPLKHLVIVFHASLSYFRSTLMQTKLKLMPILISNLTGYCGFSCISVYIYWLDLLSDRVRVAEHVL